jgi:hypothetical protein
MPNSRHMQLRIALTILFLSVISPTYGAEPELILDVRLKLHHGAQWTQVYKSREGWHCATEHNPLFPLEGAPTSFALFAGGKNHDPSCTDRFSASLQKNGKETLWTGCRSDEKIAAFLRALGRECGRF